MPPRNKSRRLSVVRIGDEEEQKILAYVQNADDETLMCRQKHDLPPLTTLKNGELPKSLSARKQRDGSWQIKQYCRRSCGYYRIINTLPGGILKPADVKFESRYEDPRYLGRGYRVPPRYCIAEMWRRMLEDLNAREDSDRAPGVKFSGGAS